MTRSTSLAAYRALVEGGGLSRRRRDVYKALYHHGPATSAELFGHVADGVVANYTQSRARFTELREMGLIREVDERPCTVTGRKAIVWDVTPNVNHGPLPHKTPRPSRDTIAAAIDTMRKYWKMVPDDERPAIAELGKWLSQWE